MTCNVSRCNLAKVLSINFVDLNHVLTWLFKKLFYTYAILYEIYHSGSPKYVQQIRNNNGRGPPTMTRHSLPFIDSQICLLHEIIYHVAAKL